MKKIFVETTRKFQAWGSRCRTVKQLAFKAVTPHVLYSVEHHCEGSRRKATVHSLQLFNNKTGTEEKYRSTVAFALQVIHVTASGLLGLCSVHRLQTALIGPGVSSSWSRGMVGVSCPLNVPGE